MTCDCAATSCAALYRGLQSILVDSKTVDSVSAEWWGDPASEQHQRLNGIFTQARSPLICHSKFAIVLGMSRAEHVTSFAGPPARTAHIT